MSFSDAVRTVLQKYAVFEGRATRSEYWYWSLFLFLVAIAGGVLAEVIGMGANALLGLFWLAVLVPSVAVGVRRLHDVGRSGWYLLLTFVPLGGLVVLYFSVQPSQPGANAYGV